jgi:hypothetical protein
LSLRGALGELRHVDHHAHALLREPPADLHAFRGLFSESPDPAQWPHVASTVAYRDLLRAAGAEALLVDEGYPPAGEALGTRAMGALAGCPAYPVLRIESLAADVCAERVAAARADGFAALKTVLAYRGGLELARADEEVLHRQAGWLASVYPNVFFDLSLTIPHVARPAAVLAEAIELAPLSKLLYASDAVRTPELYLLAAVWWRDALAAVLGPLLGDDEALAAGRLILRDNAVGLHQLTLPSGS